MEVKFNNKPTNKDSNDIFSEIKRNKGKIKKTDFDEFYKKITRLFPFVAWKDFIIYACTKYYNAKFLLDLTHAKRIKKCVQLFIDYKNRDDVKNKNKRIQNCFDCFFPDEFRGMQAKSAHTQPYFVKDFRFMENSGAGVLAYYLNETEKEKFFRSLFPAYTAGIEISDLFWNDFVDVYLNGAEKSFCTYDEKYNEFKWKTHFTFQIKHSTNISDASNIFLHSKYLYVSLWKTEQKSSITSTKDLSDFFEKCKNFIYQYPSPEFFQSNIKESEIKLSDSIKNFYSVDNENKKITITQTGNYSLGSRILLASDYSKLKKSIVNRYHLNINKLSNKKVQKQFLNYYAPIYANALMETIEIVKEKTDYNNVTTYMNLFDFFLNLGIEWNYKTYEKNNGVFTFSQKECRRIQELFTKCNENLQRKKNLYCEMLEIMNSNQTLYTKEEQEFIQTLFETAKNKKNEILSESIDDMEI